MFLSGGVCFFGKSSTCLKRLISRPAVQVDVDVDIDIDIDIAITIGIDIGIEIAVLQLPEALHQRGVS